jgi:hypothetical protein
MLGVSGNISDLWTHHDPGTADKLKIQLAPHAPLLLLVKS